ncbi:MAG: tetratricopeptide repeat protein [Phycisphaerales bacterium]
MSRRVLIGNLLFGLAGEGLGETIGKFCTACASNDRVAIAALRGGLSGGPLLAVGILAGGIGLQVWGHSRAAKKQRAEYEELSAKITSCKGDTRQIIELLVSLAERSKVLDAMPAADSGIELQDWLPGEVQRTLQPALPDNADPIVQNAVLTYLQSIKAQFDDVSARQHEHITITSKGLEVGRETLDILKTALVRQPAIPENTRENFAPAGIRKNSEFVGRRESLARVHQALTSGHNAALAHALSAEGGVGKTEIAIAYVHHDEYQDHWDGIWWLNAAPDAMKDSLKDLLEVFEHKERDGDTLRSLHRELGRRLGDGRQLVGLDNVEDGAMLREFTVGPNTRVLLTTRLAPRKVPPTLAQSVSVEVLDQDEARFLLLRHRPDVFDAEHDRLEPEHADAVDGILDKLGGHALALALCGAALRKDPSLLPGPVLEQLLDHELEHSGTVLAEVDANDTGRMYNMKVRASLLLHLGAVLNECPLAKDVLLAASLVAPQNIPLSMLVKVVEADTQEVHKALNVLHDRSILRYSPASGTRAEGLVSMHQLTQSAIRSEESEDRRDEFGSRWTEVLTEHAQDPKLLFDQMAQLEALPHAQFILDRFETATESQWKLLWFTSATLRSQDRLPQALELATRSRDLAERLFGPSAQSYVLRLHQMAGTLERQGNWEPALALAHEATDTSCRVFGDTHWMHTLCLNMLASVLETSGDLEGAHKVYEQTLDLNAQQGQSGVESRGGFLNNLGLCQYRLGRWTEAERLFSEAIAHNQHEFGEDHPVCETNYLNLGLVQLVLGKLSEALQHCKTGMKIAERSLPHDDPRLAASLNMMGLALSELDNPEEARDAMRRALDIRVLAQGDGSKAVATVQNDLALVESKLGNHNAAVGLATRAVDTRRGFFGTEHHDTAEALHTLSHALACAGRHAEAEQHARQALEARKAVFRHDNPYTAQSLHQLAIVLLELDRAADALPLAEEAVAMGRPCMPEDHPWLARWTADLSAIQAQLATT